MESQTGEESTSSSNIKNENGNECESEKVELKIIYNRERVDVVFDIDATVLKLKEHIQSLFGVPPIMQKILFKGIAKDDKTLRESGFVNGSKVMVMGSTLNDVMSVNAITKADTKEEKSPSSVKEPLCKLPQHKKVIDKGVPPDAMPGWKNGVTTLPPEPLYGMYNKSGGKVRLTFKLEEDQVWIGTRERTEKISMTSVRAVISEPIEGHEEYHMIALQLGPTEASRYWIYWVPAQYVKAIKDTIL
ncbi:ubiquitin domain-containing protein UBFD1-like isoform X2, partial [Leptotrombidium deliense]